MDSLEPVAQVAIHPCVKCGACCAYFRVMFDRSELQTDPYNVPKELTEKIDSSTLALIGTNQTKPRCVALAGRIGHSVGCTIYANRPSCCREFTPSFENGIKNSRCDDARKKKGLKPLRLLDWE